MEISRSIDVAVTPQRRSSTKTDSPTAEPRVSVRVDRIERAERMKSEAGADVLYARGHDAVWDAFYMRQTDGFAGGVGPKPPDRMAFIIKRDLNATLGTRGIAFRAEPDPSQHGAYRVTGRDRNGNGLDVSISATSEIHLEPVEFGFVARSLVTEWRWKGEAHDTGRLETRNPAWGDRAWVPEPKPNAMTGFHDV